MCALRDTNWSLPSVPEEDNDYLWMEADSQKNLSNLDDSSPKEDDMNDDLFGDG